MKIQVVTIKGVTGRVEYVRAVGPDSKPQEMGLTLTRLPQDMTQEEGEKLVRDEFNRLHGISDQGK